MDLQPIMADSGTHPLENNQVLPPFFFVSEKTEPRFSGFSKVLSEHNDVLIHHHLARLPRTYLHQGTGLTPPLLRLLHVTGSPQQLTCGVFYTMSPSIGGFLIVPVSVKTVDYIWG